MISSAFFSEMEAASQQTAGVAWDLSYRHGRLRREHVNHTAKKRSGAWGADWDKGELFFIEKLSIQAQWRRQKLDTKLFSEIARQAPRLMARPWTTLFVLVAPGSLASEVLQEGRARGLSQENPGLAAIE